MKRSKLLSVITYCLLGAQHPLPAQPNPQRYDVVIDELMVDPTPQVALPNNEWIELKNTSAVSLNLAGWRIADPNALSGPMPSFILKPDSFVVICPSSAVAVMTTFGASVAVTGFPSLDNAGDQISLKDATGKTIHSVDYDISWYQNEIKKDGGWTLEMIDTRSPCGGSSNWKASIDNNGGTPGKKNSVDGINNDETSPELKRAYAIDERHIVLVFDEPVDSLQAAVISNYAINPALSIDSAITVGPAFDKVNLRLNSAMNANTVYTIKATNIADCKNNVVGAYDNARFGLPVDALPADLVVNELLFNPRPNAYDYVEIYNKSDKIVDASRLYIANRNGSNMISAFTQLHQDHFLIFPGDYIVVTEDGASLSREYFVKNPAAVLELASFPSYPDDKGSVVLLNFQGDIVDEVDYSDDWQFKLIDNAEGVALERIDPNGPSQDRNNWHSAGSTAGYGTPGYKNSQYKLPPGIDANIEVTPKVFSPDNDGVDDIATIQYKVEQPGFVANITVFDAAGRTVRYLVRNGLLALSGYWNWDGLDDKNARLAVGSYVILTEMFNLKGQKKRFKNVVVLARRLN